MIAQSGTMSYCVVSSDGHKGKVHVDHLKHYVTSNQMPVETGIPMGPLQHMYEPVVQQRGGMVGAGMELRRVSLQISHLLSKYLQQLVHL